MKNFKEIELKEIFDFPPISGLTMLQGIGNTGNIPIYGGRKTATPIGYVSDNIDGIKYFQNCLAWNRNGSAGYVFFHNHKFAVSDDHRPMILKDFYKNNLDLEYLRFEIQKTLFAMGFSWSKKVGKEVMESVFIEIPFKENEFDLQKQREIANRYKNIAKIQNKFDEYHKLLKNINVVIDEEGNIKEIELGDKNKFDLSIGKRVLKKDIQKFGNPIYSSNVLKPFGNSNNIDAVKFNNPVLIWGIDGIFEWNIIPANTKFIPTDHCGILNIKDKNIHPEYLLYELRATKSRYGFDRTFRASLENIINVSARIPIGKNCVFDLEKQKKIASRYKKIEIIQNHLIENFYFFKKYSVNIDL
ncbi:MAG: hypothetical protein FJ368_00530 [Pelagibacterales bacterium]|nr:hypothetical protein [Pelagibacterales bacterium]